MTDFVLGTPVILYNPLNAPFVLFVVSPTPITCMTLFTQLLILVTSATPDVPPSIANVCPIPYADPPSIISIEVICPLPPVTTLAVAPFPLPLPWSVSVRLYLVVLLPYPDPAESIESPVIAFKLCSISDVKVVIPELLLSAKVTANPMRLSLK